MTKRFTSAGAMFAMRAVTGNYYLALGRGESATGLIEEAAVAGYERRPVTIVAKRAIGTNASPVQFGAFAATAGSCTHSGLYTTEAGGTCIWVGPLETAIEIVAGGTATIPAGALSLRIARLEMATATVIAPSNTALPAITGTARRGEVLTAGTGSWTGTEPITYAFQWQRGTTAIAGATAATYTPGTADVGQTLRVVVTATNTAGSAQATSPATAAVAEALVAPANTALPAITGTARRGEVLTASTGSWTGTAPITYAFQWQRGTTAIAGATAATYTPGTADVGQTLRVVVTATNTAGSAQATSPATATVAEALVAPANTALPSITGTARRGEVLTASTGSWTGTAPITYAFQWQRGTTAIAGATAATYTPGTADVGQTLRVVVTATNTAGSAQATSPATATVAEALVAPANTAAPTISGVAREGEVLTAATGSWTGTAPITYAFQWQRGTTAIAGATAATYTPGTADVGQTLRVVVTASNGVGSAAATSASTAPVSAAPLPGITLNTPLGPFATSAPVSVSGTYSGAMASANLIWEQNGNAIGSAVAITGFSNGTWAATITAPETGGVYRLRASFNGTGPTATSDDVTIGTSDQMNVATFTFDGSGDGADTVVVFGHSFPAGALPPASPIVLRRADNNAPLRTQMTPLTSWPDGTVRTAAFAGELPALANGTLLQVRLRRDETHPSPGPALTWSGALSGRSIRIRTWAPGNTTTPLWTYDVGAALVNSTDDWMAGPLAICRRVKTAVPSSAVQNTAGQTGTIQSVRLVVDVTATKDAMVLVDAAFCNDRVNHAAGGHARFGWTIEIDGTVVYDQRPSAGPARDLMQYNWWVKRRAKRGAKVYNFYDVFRPLFRPDTAALVQSHFIPPYDTQVMPSFSDAAGIADRFAGGSAKLADPYWNWGLARSAGAVGGRPEIGFHTAECAAWMAWPANSRFAERLAHMQAEAYSIGGWLYYDHEADRPIMVDEWPRFALHFSYNIPAPAPRALATGPLSSQPRQNNDSDHIAADQAHRGNYYAPVALLSGRRVMYDLMAMRSCEATLDLRHEGWRVEQGSFSNYGLRAGWNWTDTPTPVVPDVATGAGWVNSPWGPQNRSAAWAIRDLVYADYLLPQTMPRRGYYTDNLRAWINCYNYHLPNIKIVLNSDMDLVLMHGGGFHSSGYMYAFFAYGFMMAINAGLGGSNIGTVAGAFVKHRALGLENDLWARRDLDGQDQFFYSNGYSGGTPFASKAAMFAGAPSFPQANWATSGGPGVGSDYVLNALSGIAVAASSNLPPADKALARDMLVRWRSERRQASGYPLTRQADFANAPFPQTNLTTGPGWTFRCDTAPVIVAGQSFSARTNVAAGTVIGLVEWTGSIPRCSTASNANHDAFEIVNQPTGNPFTISRGGVIRRAATGTFATGPATIQVRCRTYNDANTLLMGQTVPVTIIGT